MEKQCGRISKRRLWRAVVSGFLAIGCGRLRCVSGSVWKMVTGVRLLYGVVLDDKVRIKYACSDVVSLRVEIARRYCRLRLVGALRVGAFPAGSVA